MTSRMKVETESLKFFKFGRVGRVAEAVSCGSRHALALLLSRWPWFYSVPGSPKCRVVGNSPGYCRGTVPCEVPGAAVFQNAAGGGSLGTGSAVPVVSVRALRSVLLLSRPPSLSSLVPSRGSFLARS